jgi:hypothetical protein
MTTDGPLFLLGPNGGPIWVGDPVSMPPEGADRAARPEPDRSPALAARSRRRRPVRRSIGSEVGCVR